MTKEEIEIIKIVFQSYLNIVRIFGGADCISEKVVTEVRDKLIKTLEQQRWIPVSEGLPEEMGTYMTTIDYGKCGLATGQRYYFGQGVWEDDCVIAWQPLPQPYKEE